MQPTSPPTHSPHSLHTAHPRPNRLASTLPWLALVATAAIALRSAEPTPTPTPPPAASPDTSPPIGAILPFAGPSSSLPGGPWMLCDGRTLSTSEHHALFAVIGHAWGQGRDRNEFRLPDLRGRFVRGVNHDADDALRDPDRDLRGPSAPGGNTGNEVGSLQEDAAGPHVHPLSGVADAIGQGHGAEWIRFHATKVPDDSAPVLSNSALIQPPGPAETRPRNVYVNWIIRVR